MPQYHDVTALLAWLSEFEQEGAAGTLGLFTKSVADQVRDKLGNETLTLTVHPGVYELPELPKDMTRAWTQDPHTGEPIAWEAHDMGWIPLGEYGYRNGNSMSDFELLTEHGPVFAYNPDPGECQTERGLMAGQPPLR